MVGNIKGWKRVLYSGAVVAVICSASPMIGASAPGTTDLTNFSQLYRLPKERAATNLSFRAKAVVLCYDPGWGQLYFHDGDQAKWFSPISFSNQFLFGDTVELRATVRLAEGTAALTDFQAQVLARQKLPEAVPQKLADFAKNFGQWVEASGTVRVVDTSWGRLALVIEDGTRSCLVYVMGAIPNLNAKEFVGSTVRIRGINASKIENGQLTRASLFAPDLSEVKVLRRSSSDWARLPVSAIERLFNLELGSWTNEMVHLNGAILSYKPGSSLELKDPTGAIRAEVIQMTRALPEQRADLWGFPALAQEGLILKDAYFEPIIGSTAGTNGSVVKTPSLSNSADILSNVVQVIRLSPEQAAGLIPVRLSGVVTYADPEWHNLFFHDDTGEIYVECDQANAQSGQWVELEGYTAQGGFAPEIEATRLQVLGTTNLPVAAKVDLTDLADGHLDGNWVELEGVVRRVTHEWNHLDLIITTPKGRVCAIVPNVTNPQHLPELVDCFVRLRGACGAQLNARRQLSGITLHVPSLKEIQVIDGVPADPFAVRATRIVGLAHFDPERRVGRRIKLAGTVLLSLTRGGFYLHDASGGVRIETQQPAKVRAGENVEVLGFAALGEFAPYLEEAVYRHVSDGTLPLPKRITGEEILLKGEADAELVEIEARLVQDVPHSARPKLLLQDGNVLFSATLQDAGLQTRFPKWEAGSLLQLRGICSIQADETREPQGFKILIPAVQDVLLLKAPPWWSLRRTLVLLGALSTAILAAIGWIALLRRQVRTQTQVLQQNHKELLQTSRQAGMAEVATSVLHNVGNVLNSINVSTTLLHERVHKSRASDLNRLIALLDEHATDLPGFFAKDARGDRVREFLKRLSESLAEEQSLALVELADLRKNVAHVKDIISMQQGYAKVSGVVEPVQLTELVEDTLRMTGDSLARRHIKVVREYEAVPEIVTDKHKVLQILVNLVRNAKDACDQIDREGKQLTVRVSNGDDFVRIAVLDNGMGIRPEYLTRIFNHGFTTRKDGHGFGLHSGALAAKELGGTLTVQSDGAGKGAVFTLALPIARREHRTKTALKSVRV